MKTDNSIEQITAALEEIGKLVDLIDCSNKDNLLLLPLFLAQQKRAAVALKVLRTQVLEEAATRLLELAREERNLDGATLARAAEYLRALKEQP